MCYRVNVLEFCSEIFSSCCCYVNSSSDAAEVDTLKIECSVFSLDYLPIN